jgi:hypothetical protein
MRQIVAPARTGDASVLLATGSRRRAASAQNSERPAGIPFASRRGRSGFVHGRDRCVGAVRSGGAARRCGLERASQRLDLAAEPFDLSGGGIGPSVLADVDLDERCRRDRRGGAGQREERAGARARGKQGHHRASRDAPADVHDYSPRRPAAKRGRPRRAVLRSRRARSRRPLGGQKSEGGRAWESGRLGVGRAGDWRPSFPGRGGANAGRREGRMAARRDPRGRPRRGRSAIGARHERHQTRPAALPRERRRPVRREAVRLARAIDQGSGSISPA